MQSIPESADVVVECSYNSGYSDRLFEVLGVSCDILSHIRELLISLGLVPGEYKCVHIRNTYKKGLSWEKTIETLDKGDVLITDSSIVRDAGNEQGFVCPSVIPAQPVRGGVHHNYGNLYKDSGLTRDIVNKSAITDLFIGGLAGEFIETCETSSYSQFIVRGKENNWWRKQYDG